MKVLVTGGGGFLGSHVVEQLLARGDEVRIVARGAYPALASRGVDCRRGDIADPQVVLDAVEGVDAVAHVAGQPGVWGPKEMYWRPNVTGTLNVIAACRQHGVKRLVYTSSPSAIFDDTPHEGADESVPYPQAYLQYYSPSKAEAERQVIAAHEPGVLHTASLRPHLIWGPGDRYMIPRVVETARKGKLAQVGDGKNRVSITYIDNAASAHVCALDALEADDSPAGGNVYFINDPEPVELWTFIGRILDGVGVARPKRTVSVPAARRAGAVLEVVYKLLRLPGEPRMTRFVAQVLGSSHWYCIDAAQRDLGWTPAVGLEEGLERLIADLSRADTAKPAIGAEAGSTS